ncbi:hypothetical protein COW36_10915 [bacterium (Candidatus Blackallbacteria) CG17_big_fil_post_rev_8_21_14_2_50_48_46]|uniref:PLD phosphodiesterase domain-containing protein n=1 Tax=bacterium (Candidatus Blackallbacteria) CG17_big_fil_post_rev_8_21_14_2_50_48_46 TaxID=2014261 RepID=A0A2M7G523_9BACT|nr:MAG: hypothetical protein COW64_20405 [bacterium (Candidatus Blackallbacteria) CG18_big_fil_WC_8_21_14_2_50_49_26]PIW16975.1 MAG: hypothetical protein COW36_10915 [bacterium (Candidatus Blackallbacteria) CG17_big_fil_post_rev_8_21_14_2_50_48_46]PIW50254.1 MAG: hypothetical protein COW20_03430 [bacterium (Candidatus Blackallbacteria) CG13_big_fil_rev_8_21_14_2_50_49_14]
MVNPIEQSSPLPFPFANQPENICRPEPEKLICEAEPSLDLTERRFPQAANSGKAQPQVDFAQLNAQADLELELTDSNGVLKTGKEDIHGQLSGEIILNGDLLNQNFDALKKSVSSAQMKSLSFDPDDRAYVIGMKAKTLKGLLWDNFEIRLKATPAGQLYLDVDENWFPNSSILSRLRDGIKQALNSHLNQKLDALEIELETRRDGDKLYLTPAIKKLKFPLDADHALRFKEIQNAIGRFSIDPKGHLHLRFDKLELTGSTDPQAARGPAQSTPDALKLKLEARSYKDKHHEMNLKGKILLDIDAQEAQKIKMGGETLSKRVSQTGLEADLDSTISISAAGKVNAQAQNHWQLKNTVIEGKTYQIEAEKIEVSLDTQSGLSLEVKTHSPTQTFRPQLSQNTVEPLIDGPNYHEEMKSAIAGAQESIEIESFLYYDEPSTRDLARQLLLKAAGLKPGKSRLVYDPLATQGLPVHILVNHRLTQTGFESVKKIFAETQAQLSQEIQTLPISDAAKADYLKRMQTHLKLGALTDGVAKADHRKLLLIDGKTGYTGGINLGDHFLKPDSYHDIMLKVTGPAVGEMRAQYAANWQDFTGKPAELRLKSKSELEKAARQHAHSTQQNLVSSGIVTTDDSSNQIEAALLDAIGHAKKEINIEHAYFYHPAVLQALKNAVSRGVTVKITVPDKSDEDLYNIINADMIRQLMETAQKTGKGKVQAWLYTGTPGKYSHMAHTKALSVDGETAVIGSANLIPRSLNSPFRKVLPDGSRQNILFNEEMSLYLHDAQKVKELDQKLFEFDRNQKSKPFSYAEVLKRIQDLGGEKVLQQEKLKANLS